MGRVSEDVGRLRELVHELYHSGIDHSKLGQLRPKLEPFLAGSTNQ